jgi:hypothetical protein
MRLRTTLAPVLLALAAPLASAKLPPLSPEAQVKADEAKAKAAWADKVAAFQLCRAIDRVADGYMKSAKASGKPAAEPVATPPCTDPGPFVAPAAASAPPIEAAGAHSPATAATAPPNTNTPQAELQGGKKP